jgi:hypothetical protein
MAQEIVAFLKGRMAEVMVERLFGVDYHVRNFGAPWKFITLPIIKGEEKSPRSSHDLSRYSRTDEPDFVIFPKGKIAEPKEFVEVKFRADGILMNKRDGLLKETCEFWGEYLPLNVVLVSSECRPYFQVLRAPFVKKDGRFVKLIPLLDAGWNINLNVYAQCEILIEKGVFDNVRL